VSDDIVCREGHVKRNPDTGEVAIRTALPDGEQPLSAMAWVVVLGSPSLRHTTTAEVADWPDLFVPPVPEEPEPEPAVLFDPTVDATPAGGES